MKNFTLLLVLLLPLFGFSQVELVKWNKASLASTNLQSGALGATITTSTSNGNQVSITPNTTWEATHFFLTSGWPAPIYSGPGVSINTNRFVQFAITAQAGKTINLSSLNFQCRSQGNTVDYEIRYSKNSDFSSGVSTLVPQTNVGTTWKDIPTNSFSNLALLANETLYIRLYVYNSNDNFHLKFSENNVGPSITGTVTTACTPPGDQTTFGSNVWNGYVYTYTGNNTDFSTATYIGTVTETPVFDRNVTSGQVNGVTRNIPCVTPPSDRFMVRYKMRTNTLAAGDYNFTVGGDDGYRLYIDGALQTGINSFVDHSYTQLTIKKALAAGTHEFILEYFEKESDSRVMFSYGKVNITATPFGDNVWNIYGYTSDTDMSASTLVGSYVDPNVNINTENFWNNEASPSAYSSYSGAPIPKDYFTTVYKRKGFPCGNYTIKFDKWDDDFVIFLNGVQIGAKSGNASNYSIPTNYKLNSTSEIEVRLAERGGAATLQMSLVDNPTVYNASSSPTPSDVAGTSIRVEKNLSLSADLNVCSCTVVNGNTLTVPAGKTLVIQENLTVETGATMTIENNGSLVQVKDSGINTGIVNVKRTTTPIRRYDFTYWSSPVGSGFTLNNLSPNTLADKYYGYNPTTGWVTYMNGNIAMEAGKGYLVRAPQEYAVGSSAVYNGTFIGKPNNGVINQTIVANASNLIGNPYPSAIDANKLYLANSSLIKGTFYFWTHGTPVSSTPDANGVYNYSPDNYISYNATGATGTDVVACATCGNTASNKHNGNIASGQGFFVQSKAGGQLVYNNSLRVATSGTNSQFLRSANTTQSGEGNDSTAVEKNRVWLNIKNDAGAYNEALIGYVTGATNDMDDAFDGATYASGTALYTVLDNQNLVIQGRALPFTNTDVVALGYSTNVAGQFTIGIESFDGLFDNQNVYLVDKSDNSYHNLKAGRYTFTSAIGTFNSRFEIRYVNDTELGVDTPIVSNNDVIVYKSGNQIAVRATNFTIDNVQVYDMTGKVIFSKAKINSNEFSTTGLNVGTQVVIVKVNLDDNQTVSKKVIMN